METVALDIGGCKLPVHHIKTIVIGSGCAGFNAIDWLYDLGERDMALVTEGMKKGTSRNTGSDKQTYYKLSLASEQADSIGELAKTLANGIGVNGDTALVEAACSVKSFFKLVNLGVPFPTNKYGEYVGYKTDHDPRQRATSAGPLTSKIMTECLEGSVIKKNIAIMDNMQVVKLITEGGKIIGVLAIDLMNTHRPDMGFTLFECNHVIMATGGPAAVYDASVYPESQTGMTGMALEAGARAANLQEWQYGLASVKFRWNVSGTYQQVLPRFITIDDGGNEREFLNEYFDDPFDAINLVFLKGYQWPFDTAKMKGSSLIDLIVHHETLTKGNRVYMDFRKNPACLDEFGFERLSDEAHEYLYKSGALIDTPIGRLSKMNQPAIDLYACNKIDLYKEPLEVSVCAQHCNGGIEVDTDWQSNIRGLYVVGEAAGTFGVYRPGGSALNSTQVGSLRAAEHIAYCKKAAFEHNENFSKITRDSTYDIINNSVKLCKRSSGVSGVSYMKLKARKLMSTYAAHIRDLDGIVKLEGTLQEMLKSIYATEIAGPDDLPDFFKYRDSLFTQLAIISSVISAAEQYGSRGSSLIVSIGGTEIMPKLLQYNFIPLKDTGADKIMITFWDKLRFRSEVKNTRVMPTGDDWFENVWNEYKKRIERGGENQRS